MGRRTILWPIKLRPLWLLPGAMFAHGFEPLDTEWWHFTLEDEPYPDTYFTFPVNSDSVSER